MNYKIYHFGQNNVIKTLIGSTKKVFFNHINGKTDQVKTCFSHGQLYANCSLVKVVEKNSTYLQKMKEQEIFCTKRLSETNQNFHSCLKLFSMFIIWSYFCIHRIMQIIYQDYFIGSFTDDIHIYTHIHTYIHTHIHTYIHPHAHTYIQTLTHTYIYIYIYIHTSIHPYIHTYINIYTYIHTFVA